MSTLQQRIRLGILGSGLLFVVAISGCGSDPTQGTSVSSSGSSESGSVSSSGSSGGGSGGEGGAGGTGGAGGEAGAGGGGGAPVGNGPGATDMVSAGNYIQSQKYKMAFTLGQSTQNQTKTTSSNYRMQGGLIGANGSLP
jgi:hypothetical protein